MIIVYFETKKHNYSEIAGVFPNEATYQASMAGLTALARSLDYVITESHDVSVGGVCNELQGV